MNNIINLHYIEKKRNLSKRVKDFNKSFIRMGDRIRENGATQSREIQ